MSHQGKNKTSTRPELFTSTREYFSEVVNDAVSHRRVKSSAQTQNYIVGLLEHYMLTVNLYAEPEDGSSQRTDTLAEAYLKASAAELPVKVEMLKRLGDTSLYISGFFGDSLHRKLVDVDYYAGIGGSAYSSLAHCAPADLFGKVYQELAVQFLEYVDVLTYISQQALVQTDGDLLRLYNRYMATGSKLAEEQLIEKGVITIPSALKVGKQ